jgi:subtilisin family serine protease
MPAAGDGEPRVNVMVELEAGATPDALDVVDFKKGTDAGSVLTGTIPLRHIEDLQDVPGLKRAEHPRMMAHELDLALPDARVNSVHDEPLSRRGSGAIVGIIDHGIDFRHASFRREDGTTRILAIWDQSLDAVGDERPPRGFDYGVEYQCGAINAALLDSSSTLVRHTDAAPNHGTHVAGIAAGNGRPNASGLGTGRLIGVAPEADLIIVSNTRPRLEDPGTVGDSADTLDAVSYILRLAEEKDRPVAVNLSQGDNIGPHDGTSLLEVGIANLLDGPGRVLVKSAGNEGLSRSHAENELKDDKVDDVTIRVPASKGLLVDFWYDRPGRIALSITPPGGAAKIGPFAPQSSGTTTLEDGTTVFVDADLDDPGNHDNRIFVALEPADGATLPQGDWHFQLSGSGTWHAWIQRDSPATFETFGSAKSTISIPGTACRVISVGAHVTREPLGTVGALSDISSRGPTRKGERAPSLSAPGEKIFAAQPGDHFVGMKGTSMSAAMVTGAAALLLSIDRNLSSDDVRQCLERTARSDHHTGTVPNNDWGAGKLDVFAAVEDILP